MGNTWQLLFSIKLVVSNSFKLLNGNDVNLLIAERLDQMETKNAGTSQTKTNYMHSWFYCKQTIFTS